MIQRYFNITKCNISLHVEIQSFKSVYFNAISPKHLRRKSKSKSKKILFIVGTL